MIEYQQNYRDALSLPLKYTVTSLGPDRRHPKLAQSGSRPVSVCHGIMKYGVDLGEFLPNKNVSFGWGSLGDNKGQR